MKFIQIALLALMVSNTALAADYYRCNVDRTDSTFISKKNGKETGIIRAPEMNSSESVQYMNLNGTRTFLRFVYNNLHATDPKEFKAEFSIHNSMGQVCSKEIKFGQVLPASFEIECGSTVLGYKKVKANLSCQIQQ